MAIGEKLSQTISPGEGFVDIRVYVKTESNIEELRFEGDELVFYTTEPPIEGRANAALIRYLSRVLKHPSSKIEIVHGLRSRSKTVRVYEIEPEALVERLALVIKD